MDPRLREGRERAPGGRPHSTGQEKGRKRQSTAWKTLYIALRFVRKGSFYFYSGAEQTGREGLGGHGGY